jgi:hypothetical protein
VEHRTTADQIEKGVNRLKTLTNEPELERRHMMGYDFNDYLNMSERERANAMKDLFDSTVDLDTGQRTMVVKTRTDIMTSLPRAEREKLMQTARTIYSTYDEERMAIEKKAIEEATAQYNPLKRTLVRRMYREIMA